jgi:iron complex outermembrane receptor protein
MRFAPISYAALAASLLATTPAFAQAAGGSDEIVVTARKRDESLISTPVVVTAVSGNTLAQRGVINLDGLAQIVPQLLIGPQGGAVQGGNVSIRGVSGPDQNPFGDQAVSFNVDGVQIAKATVRRMSDFDMAQVEVLKGPQALFFGKNSPAGIVSIRTADPTKSLEGKVSVGYEFKAHQVRTEGYVSGPVSDELGFRVAGMYSDMRGYLKDMTPKDSVYYDGGHNPNAKEWAVRGTLKWEPSADFNARLKLNYADLKQNGPAAATAFISCPTGSRTVGAALEGLTGEPAIDQCKANGKNVNAGYGELTKYNFGQGIGFNRFRDDGSNFLHQKQFLGGLEMNYNISDALTVTSVTGLYSVKLFQCQNYENDIAVILPSCNALESNEFSQELRFSSDYDGPLNFTGGAYFSKTKADTGSLTWLYGGAFPIFSDLGTLLGLGADYGGPTNPALLNNYRLKQKGTAYSAYLQLIYKPIDVIEIDVGGRYSKEKKRLPMVRSGGGLQDGVFPGFIELDDSTEIAPANLKTRKGSWNDFSPEVTVSYRPNTDLTVFGSYKHGFLSGGFNSGSVTFTTPGFDLSYDQQTIKGFEAGIKANLLDRALRVNFALYKYDVANLQVSNVINSTNTIDNAGAVKVKGVEFDFNYRTPVDGLTLHGAAAYNKGKYSSYPEAPCYGGQTLATGCVGGSQNLSGTELIRAPKWNLSGGFNFETPVSDSMKFGLSGDVTHSSSYLTDSSSAPNGRQPSYTLLNASARIGEVNDTWELALIGRNLADKYYFVASSLVPFADAFSAPGALVDRFASISRGREIMLRVSYKFGGK